MSWSENRSASSEGAYWNKDKIAKHVKQINAVLTKLAADEDLQDDLKLPPVIIAINHWTGKHRLNPEDAAKLQNNRRIVYVLQRMQMLAHVCREGKMAVPLDHLMKGIPQLRDEVILKTYQEDFRKIMEEEEHIRKRSREDHASAIEASEAKLPDKYEDNAENISMADETQQPQRCASQAADIEDSHAADSDNKASLVSTIMIIAVVLMAVTMVLALRKARIRKLGHTEANSLDSPLFDAAMQDQDLPDL